MTNDLSGRVVDGRYELLEQIGEGATGAVYRAHQDIVDREVAVKLLHQDVAEDSDYRARFEREARALGRLDHPGCVRVHDFGWWEELDAPFLVAEFVRGESLHRRVGDLSVNEVVEFGHAIAEAMAHAHAEGIIHRDLKPENVIVSSDEGLKVVDFGLARMPGEEETRLTRAGDAYGTPAYMSPEQCQADEDVGPPTDVYALGCMLWEMLHGELPFMAKKASAMLIKHVTSPVPDVRREGVPPALSDLISQMMSKSQDERPTMTAVADTLRPLVQGESPIEQSEDEDTSLTDSAPAAVPAAPDDEPAVATADTEHLPPVAQRTEVNPPANRLPVVVIGAALLVAVVAGIWFLTPDVSNTESGETPRLEADDPGAAPVAENAPEQTSEQDVPGHGGSEQVAPEREAPPDVVADKAVKQPAADPVTTSPTPVPDEPTEPAEEPTEDADPEPTSEDKKTAETRESDEDRPRKRDSADLRY